MARNIEPACKICRREKDKIFLKGERCLTDKCAFTRRPYPPGEKGHTRPRETEYLIQLREKQKAKRYYGLMEEQFHNTYKKATRQKGITGENLLRLLEMRLDNVVYLLGLAMSRDHARQLVNHGHIMVNDRKTDISSYQLKPDDVVQVVEKSRGLDQITASLESSSSHERPQWLEFDKQNLKGTVLRPPTRGEITIPVSEQLIVELYSK
ncbi:MAG: 30S ribosomal protein S4 [Actinobacteria bacterium]|nr:30S ribosomal protein S4 [Actinomycetota bacterium]